MQTEIITQCIYFLIAKHEWWAWDIQQLCRNVTVTSNYLTDQYNQKSFITKTNHNWTAKFCFCIIVDVKIIILIRINLIILLNRPSSGRFTIWKIVPDIGGCTSFTDLPLCNTLVQLTVLVIQLYTPKRAVIAKSGIKHTETILFPERAKIGIIGCFVDDSPGNAENVFKSCSFKLWEGNTTDKWE